MRIREGGIDPPEREEGNGKNRGAVGLRQGGGWLIAQVLI